MVKWMIRVLLLLVIGFVLFCAAYFVKSRLPFQFSETISIHQYFPFNYLARKDTFELSGPGPVLADNFDKWIFFSRWYHIWSSEADKVEIVPDDNGYNGSGCLSVVSRSNKAWAVSPSVFIEVEPGTILVFNALVKTDLEGQNAGLRLAGFDRAKKKRDGQLARVEMPAAHSQWHALEMRFTVPEGITYVSPRIRGTGMGKTRMDNIVVSRQ